MEGQLSFGIVAGLVVVALAFDFMNGFHDAANSISTVVSTRVLKPYQAVALAAMFNFVALFIFHLSVAGTIGKGIIEQGIVDHYVVLGALVGAISWNIITWHYGLPSSSSHALIGGLVGAGVAKAGTWALIPAGILKTVAFIFISPLLGFALGSLLYLAISWLFVRSTPSRIDRLFRRFQLFSSSLYSLGHGGNDAQKTIGIIWMLLIAGGYTAPDGGVPAWVVIACYVTIGFGTLFGGWRIVKTMGQRITKVRPVGGFCAELSGSIALFTATAFGIPVSTTHTIAGAIAGVGSAQNVSAVRWGIAGNLLWAWILTIPCSAFIAGLAWWFGRLLLAPAQ
ncbi:MAG: inorganic phosphate transporter [Burkholderiales bacterium]